MAENKKKNTVIWIGLIALISILVIGGSILYVGSRQTAVQEQQTLNCEEPPYIDLVVSDAINTGTAVSSLTNSYAVNGNFIGSFTTGASGTDFTIGDDVDLLLTKTNFIDVTKENIKIKNCGQNLVTASMYATDASVIQIKNSVGDVVTDNIAGGATNQSQSATNIDMEFKVTGNADQSSGNLICVFEATNKTQINQIVLSGASSADTPEFYSENGANAYTKAFRLDELVDGASKVYNLRIEPASGITINNCGIYATCYSEQAFADVDGSFQVGIENSDDSTKYEDTFDYDFLIKT